VPALIGATKQPEVDVRTTAVVVLGAMGNNAAEAVPTLIALVDNPDAGCAMPALQALGRIDAEAVTIVPFLAGKIVNSSTPSVRSFAARALGDLGPVAKDALPAFKTAWDKRYLTIEDAQAIYEIDPATAESLKIPRRPPGVGRPPGFGNGPERELRNP
jgi:HEAT repeat protein